MMLASTSRISNKCAQRSLSPRQAQIAALVARGKSSRAIAQMLYLSPRTVDVHIAAILEKCGMRSRLELATWLLAGEAQLGEERAAHSVPATNLALSRSIFIGP